MCGEAEARAQQVQQLRRQHPGWWIWHSHNPGFRGFYARRMDAQPLDETLRADEPDELTRLIHDH